MRRHHRHGNNVSSQWGKAGNGSILPINGARTDYGAMAKANCWRAGTRATQWMMSKAEAWRRCARVENLADWPTNNGVLKHQDLA